MAEGSPVSSVAQVVTCAVRKELDELSVESIKSRPTICKVPADVRKGHEEAYEPKLVSIGPFHRQNGNTTPMAKLKLWYVQDLLARTGDSPFLMRCADAIAGFEDKVRQQYSDPIGLRQDEFVKLLVVDGCFVIEFLLKHAVRKIGKPLEGDLRSRPMVRHDFILMENQIPFFVLHRIYENARDHFSDDLRELSLLNLALYHLSKQRIFRDESLQEKYSRGEIHHLLHLSYLTFLLPLDSEEGSTVNSLPSPPETLRGHLRKELKDCTRTMGDGLQTLHRKMRHGLSWVIISLLYIIISFFRPDWRKGTMTKTERGKPSRRLPTAMELKDAGVWFKKKENERSHLDMSFVDGMVEMAPVHIDEMLCSQYRNYLEIEQRCPDVGNRFTSHMLLMSNLIDTAADVSLLKRSGVIYSTLGCDQAVADFFNEVGSFLFFDFVDDPLKNFSDSVNEYRNKDHNRWRAMLRNEYFGNPWSIVSLLAAVVLLGLTAVQTAFTIKSS